MQNISIHLEVKFSSPIHIGTGEGFAGIIDRKTLIHTKDAKKLPIILGHTVKGIVKDQYRRINTIINHNHNNFDTIFGTKEIKGQLHFSPWTITKEFEELVNKDTENLFYSVKSGNQIVRGRRVAKAEHLFTYEVVSDKLQWEGTISGIISDKEATISDIPISIFILLLSLKSVNKIGGRRRSGTGQCQVSIKKMKICGKEYNEESIEKILLNNTNQLVRSGCANE